MGTRGKSVRARTATAASLMSIALLGGTVLAGSTQAAPATSNATCGQPSGMEKGALRFATRGGSNKELRDYPWALVRSGGMNYMAALIDSPGPTLAVLVSFPTKGAYLSGMRAINGTARSFTDLPAGPRKMPSAGSRALNCVLR